MNNIYKVIWSKAKNCYVVASEIARSHTKSATGSEKIGGVTRRSLLASLMALSLLCGGLGVASAADGTVHVEDIAATATSKEVYTADKVDTLIGKKIDKDLADATYAKSSDVATNTANINNLDGKLANLTTTVSGKADEAAVTTALDSKADTDLSNLTAAGETKIKDTMSADMDLKANKADVNTALDGKADKATVTDLATKVGDASSGLVKDVATLKTTVGDASSGLVKDVADLKTQGNDLNTAIGNKADQSDLDAAKAKITTNETNITALQTKTTGLSADGKSLNSMNRVETDALKVTGEISNGAGVTTTLAKINDSMTQTATNTGDITNLKTKTDGQQTAINGLNEKTTQISYNAAEGTTVHGVKFKDAEVDANGKGLTGVSTLHTTGAATIGGALTAAEVNAGTGAITGGSLSVIGAVNGISVNAGTLNTTGDATVGGDLSAKNTEINGTLHATGATTLDGALTAKGEAAFEKNVTMDQKLSVTGDTTLKNTDVNGALNVTGASDLKGDVTLGTPNGANTVTVNGTADFNAAVKMNKGLNVTSGESSLKNTTVDGTLNVNKETKLNDKLTVTGEATFKDKVTMEKDLEVKGELKTDKIAMENKKTDADGTIHNSTTTITADGITHNGEVKKNGVTTESQFTHTEKGSETYAKRGDATDWTETRSDLTADGVTTEVKDSKGNRTNTSQTANEIKGFVIDQDGNSSTASQTAKGINGNVTDKDGNKTDMKVTATENSIQIQDKDGKNKNHQVNTKDSSVTEITNGDGKTTKTEQTATDITNTAKDGTITNDANHIVNKANTMDTNVTGKATESYGSLDTTVNGNETHIVTGTKTETVDGMVTENYKAGQATNVTGNQDIHVTGKQTNTVEGGQENIISGGQTNTITGGQINNITGDQTTTITGNKTETVTENVTEDYQKDLTTTVGGNENHEVKGTKTETVEGKVTENYKAGQETNVTGDQDITVSGTQTTKATDINRNASSGMIDTIDNDYGTNTETKVAGKTTTDVSIKGTGEEGKYIRGANESRDYLIKGTLKNTETKTVDATSTEITDGNGKTSATIQDKTQISGSVTNGTSSAVSNVKADSIDTAVIEGTNTSLISQKKDSITSAVGNGTTSTVIQQGDKDITIASNGGTVGIVGKDIINNATNEITNTAGTKITDKVGNNTRVIDQTSITDTVGTASRKIEDGKITDTAGDSTVTTENGKGTTFAKAGSAAYSKEAGAPTDTNIAGNHITTGRVDANELGVSDKDDQGNTADFSVKAGEGIKGYAADKDGNKTYTKVTATENSFQVQDKDGKNKNHQVNTMGSSVTEITDKDGNTTKTEQTATDITNEASNSITDKVGTNTRVLNKDGITDTVGGSTFKQRIDAIMMESKNVSIKAEETLTNEAKVITNKASEVINNEAVNINNTATGIITSKASEIKNQADKLISNKVGENTWENMENGKITTSIKDGAKQNLTQSDAAGTTQSTVDGGKSTVTIQNADGLADAVTDGTNTSVQNQTASAIAAAVKDGAGNENASVANATTSVNTIKSGSKVNTVISTADGTSFINSEAAAPVGDGTEVKTTIKGNTITTGKVTMDYAEVMKDLGVRGNANITGKTTTGSLEVTGTSTLKGDVTMGSNATVKKDLTVEGNTNLKNTKVDGTLDVTQKATFGDSVSIAKDLSVDGNATIKGDVTAKSYKVGDKTYISAAGINANDQKITNVADGSISEGSKDAVNGGQLYGVKNDLEGKVNKVGANAAAMANLHPMEFDPDSKWNIAAAIGNYGSETAAALGAFYRPNDDVMVNLSTAFGTGENMVGGGVSVRLGKSGNKLSREENNALKDQVNDLTARMDALLSVLNPNMSKDFPDVPENHWAYEAVSRLAGNDIVQGYPDGEFHGERTMTRYEMAEIIYNALSRGAEAEKELVEEFKPELQAMAASEKATAEKAEG